MIYEVKSSRYRLQVSAKCSQCGRMIAEGEMCTWRPVFGGDSEDRIPYCDTCRKILLEGRDSQFPREVVQRVRRASKERQ